MRASRRLGKLLALLVGVAGCGGDFAAADDGATPPFGEDDDNDNEPWLDGGPTEDDAAAVGDDVSEPWDDDAAVIDDDAADPADAARADAGRDAATPPPACTPRTYRLYHLQASTQQTDPPAQLAAAIDAAFGAGAHTISWTEIGTLTQMRRIAARGGWATFWPSGRIEDVSRNQIPLSWRTDTFRLVRGTSYFASEGLERVSPPRWVTRVWLRHIASGRIVSRVAHHAVSGVDGQGKSPVAWRRRMHALDIAKFREVMLLDTVPVVGSGDFNTTRLRTLLGTAFRYDVPASGGSHGARLIDWVVRRPHADMRFVSASFVQLGASDHRGVRAAYDYRPPCE